MSKRKATKPETPEASAPVTAGAYRLKAGRKFYQPTGDGRAVRVEPGTVVELTPNQVAAFGDAFETV